LKDYFESLERLVEKDEKDTNMASGGVIFNFDKGMAYTDIDRLAPRKFSADERGEICRGSVVRTWSCLYWREK